MARNTNTALKDEIVKNRAQATDAEVKAEYTKDQLKGMAALLSANEKAIIENLGDIAHSEYAIGQALIQIQDDKLFVAAKEPAKDFTAYITARAKDWRTSVMTLRNYMNLATLDRKVSEKVGLTLATKIAALKKVDEKAAEKALSTAVEIIDAGKTRSDATAKVVDIATKAREKAGVNRAPGRNGKKVEEAQEAIKEAKKAPVDEISEKDRAVVDWSPLPVDKATDNKYTKIAIVEVAGLRLQVRSSNNLVDVKVIAQLKK